MNDSEKYEREGPEKDKAVELRLKEHAWMNTNLTDDEKQCSKEYSLELLLRQDDIDESKRAYCMWTDLEDRLLRAGKISGPFVKDITPFRYKCCVCEDPQQHAEEWFRFITFSIDNTSSHRIYKLQNSSISDFNSVSSFN